MELLVRGIDSEYVKAIRGGGLDANGQVAERRRAIGIANPCRHCLELIGDGEEMLVLAFRPFTRLQPYAEVGPIYLHANDCPRYESRELPSWFAYLEPALIRGYGSDDRIRYETGSVVPGGELTAAATRILSEPDLRYVHIRSKYNCFQCQVDRR